MTEMNVRTLKGRPGPDEELSEHSVEAYDATEPEIGDVPEQVQKKDIAIEFDDLSEDERRQIEMVMARAAQSSFEEKKDYAEMQPEYVEEKQAQLPEAPETSVEDGLTEEERRHIEFVLQRAAQSSFDKTSMAESSEKTEGADEISSPADSYNKEDLLQSNFEDEGGQDVAIDAFEEDFRSEKRETDWSVDASSADTEGPDRAVSWTPDVVRDINTVESPMPEEDTAQSVMKESAMNEEMKEGPRTGRWSVAASSAHTEGTADVLSSPEPTDDRAMQLGEVDAYHKIKGRPARPPPPRRALTISSSRWRELYEPAERRGSYAAEYPAEEINEEAQADEIFAEKRDQIPQSAAIEYAEAEDDIQRAAGATAEEMHEHDDYWTNFERDAQESSEHHYFPTDSRLLLPAVGHDSEDLNAITPSMEQLELELPFPCSADNGNNI